ncbi:MAG: protein kinase, partial [Gemmatimonadota bacterium]|nr:protein kinase [Gemmatimonadota bacterium]
MRYTTTDLRDQLQASLAGTYELERELGGGGMSRVFLAHETALGRTVVVKVLLPTLAAGVSADRFRREILLVAKLQHPHIVPVHAAGESEGLPWFTMPYVEGETLRARITREGELPVSEVLRLLRDIASALSYAHARGVIHRDIKPDNVLLSAGSAVVADFGVAKALSESVTEGDQSHVTSLGIALGTPAYMAPEQAAGEPSLDHRVDLYAFGVMAYEMLAGRAPFTARNAQAMFAAHFTEAPVPIESLRPSVPPALAAMVMRCLEKHAADRPSSADDILHVLDSMTTPSGGNVPTTELRLPRRRGTDATPVAQRTPWPWIGAGIAALAVIAMLVLVPQGPRGDADGATPEVTLEAPVPAPSADTAEPDAATQPTFVAPAPAEPPSRRAAEPPAAAPAPDTIVMARLRLDAIEARRNA